MTTESAVWLGLLETGWQSGPNDALELSHVRLTAWGRFYLDQSAGDFPTLAGVTLEDHFTVLPNLDLTIPPRLDARTLTSLFKLAELQSPHRFVLTKSSLRDAFDEGFTPEQALGFLAEHARAGVPPSVSQWIKECAEKHGQVKVGKSGTYVEVTDPVILVELKTKRELKELLIKTIGDRVALFSEPDPDRILKLLKKLGFSPVLITSTTE